MFDYESDMRERLNTEVACLKERMNQLTAIEKSNNEFFKRIFDTVEHYKKYGELPAHIKAERRSSLKENKEINVKLEKSSPKKPKRKALAENRHLNGEDEQTEITVIKSLKSENDDPEKDFQQMPPPNLPLKKPIKTENSRSTRSRARPRNTNASNGKSSKKDSDVILNDVTIPILEISSDDDQSKTSEPELPRVTRSKARKPVDKTKNESVERPKRSRSESSENTKKDKKQKSKHVKKPKDEHDQTDKSEYEDAVDEVSKDNAPATNINDATVIISRNPDATYIQEPQNKDAEVDANDLLKDIMTDDDSPLPAQSKKNAVTAAAKKNVAKQIFSPYESSPVRKKVAAFEKLGAECASEIPVRSTRTKTKAQAKQNEEDENQQIPKAPSSAIKEKPKYATPLRSQLSKQNSNDSLLGSKTLSSVKASQANFREKELRRQKEEEKRQAQLQAQMDEKRRKREEKQMKAQQAREQREKEKIKQLEMAEKLKEEKHRQALAEREAKLQKQREEMEKKRLLAKKKALEERSGSKEQQKKLPVYMTSDPPLLPTYDCYDSDDERRNRTKLAAPQWTKPEELIKTERTMIALGESIKNTLFCRHAQTIDLTKIFEDIDPRRLKRTSSAIWHKPPRYTLAPTLDVTMERNDDSDEE